MLRDTRVIAKSFMLCCVVPVVGVDCCGFCQKYWVYTHELWVLSSVWVASSLLRGETWWIWSLRWLFPGSEWLASDLCEILGSRSFLTTPAISGGCFPTLLDQGQSEEPPRAETTPSWQVTSESGSCCPLPDNRDPQEAQSSCAVRFLFWCVNSNPHVSFLFLRGKKKKKLHIQQCAGH